MSAVYKDILDLLERQDNVSGFVLRQLPAEFHFQNNFSIPLLDQDNYIQEKELIRTVSEYIDLQIIDKNPLYLPSSRINHSGEQTELINNSIKRY